MPMFYFKCCHCPARKRRICSVEESKEIQQCECGYTMCRDPKPPTSASKETLDNGIMTKAIERFTDAEEVFGALGEAEKKLKE